MENEERVEGGVCNGVEDHQSEEDEKMEKFFALIRSFHEARTRRRQELNHELEDKKKKNKTRRLSNDEDQQQSSSWVPSFEWQDFTEEIEFRRLPTNFPSPCNKKDLEKKTHPQDHDGLDLKLTL